MTHVRFHHPLAGLTVLAAATLVYGIMFFLFFPVIGAEVSALAALPVIVAGWYFGLRAGLVAGLLAFPFLVLLLNLMGAPGIEVMLRGGMVGSGIVVLVGVVVGRLHDMGAALQASEERYRLISELISDYAASVRLEADGDFKLEWVAGSFERFTGYTMEALNADLLALTHPEDRDAVLKRRQQVLEGLSVSGNQRIIAKSGEVRWLQTYRQPMWDAEHKRVVGFYVVVQDITERKQAEEERKAHLWFLQSMDQINRVMQGTDTLEQMMSAVLDTLLTIFACDRAWLVYPCDPDSPTWQVPMERTRPEYPGVLPIGVELLLEPAGAAVYRILRDSPVPVQFGLNSKHQVPVEMARGFNVQSFIAMAFYPKVGKPWAFGLHQCAYPRTWTPDEERLFQEIGRRLADSLTGLLIDRALRESEERYRLISELISDYAFSIRVGEDGTLAYEWVTEFFPRVTGYTMDEINADMMVLIHPEDREAVRARVEQVLQGQSVSGESRILTKSGEVRWVHIYRRPLWDAEHKRVVRYYGVIQDITARKQAEEALRESERRLAEAQRIAHVGYWDCDLDTDSITLSDEVYRVFGLPMDERIVNLTRWNEQWEEQIHPADRLRITQAAADALGNGPRYDVEYRVICPNGEMRVIHSQGDVMKDESGRPRRMFGMMQDITARKQAEEKLLRQNAYLNALHETALALTSRLNLEEMLEAIIVRATALVDTEHGCIYFLTADEAEMIVQVGIGFTREFLGRRSTFGKGLSGTVWQTGETLVVEDYATWPGRWPDPAFDMVHAEIGLPLKAGDRVIGALCLHHLDDKKFTQEDVETLTRFAALASIALDNARLYTSAQQELAERKRVEAELRQLNVELEQRVRERTAELHHERTLLQTILDSMGEGLLYIEDNRLRYVNNAVASLSGYEIGELVGQINTVLMSDQRDEQEARIFRDEALEPGTIWRGTTQFQRKDGSEFDAALTVTIIADGGIVVIVRDVTAENQLQAQKARFIANASHELRTPITNFKTRLYLLGKQPEQLETHVAILQRIAEQMTNLVEDLLDMSRFERGVVSLQCRDVLVQTLINEAVQLQQPEAARKGITLAADLPSDPVHVLVDPNRIMQVLVNLITNGINYTPDNGHVSVELRLEASQDYVVICVRDTGIGIAPEHLPRLTEPFFRASESGVRGTGLGLSISKEIVELHRGSILVESKLGEGSTFYVRLPVS